MSIILEWVLGRKVVRVEREWKRLRIFSLGQRTTSIYTHLCHSVCQDVIMALVASVPERWTVGSRDDVVIVSAVNEKLWEPD